MAYQKRNFKKDQLLTAEDLNAMDDQIALNEESAKKANDDIKNKLDKSAVVQEKGNSETAVMSQDAATEEFDKLSEDIADFENGTYSLTAENITSIPENADLDDYKSLGNYKVTSTAISQTIGNIPHKLPGRLTVYGAYDDTSKLVQIYTTGGSVPYTYLRNYNNEWKSWHRVVTHDEFEPLIAKALKSSNIAITSSNYTDYFADYNDIPINTVYNINYGVPLANSPEGEGTLNQTDSERGFPSGTVFTISGHGDTSQKRGRMQIFVTSAPSVNQSIISFRSAYVSAGELLWTPWQKYSETYSVTASNIVIRKATAHQFFTDLNDAPINSIYQIDLDCDVGTLANHPNPGQSCVLMTFGYSHVSRHGMVQMCFGLGGATKMFYRYGYVQSSTEYRWTAWEKVFTESSETSDYLVNMGRLPDGSDLNNITGNCYYLVGDNAGNQNVPTEESGFITSKNVKNITLHTFEALTGERYSRYAVAGEWSEWVDG